MARRRKLYGAALAAHRRKLGKKSTKSVVRKHRIGGGKLRKRHHVKRYHVKSFMRKGSRVSPHWVKSHMSNPFGGMFSVSFAQKAALMTLAGLGAWWVSRTLSDQAELRLPGVQAGLPNAAVKVLAGIVTLGAAGLLIRNPSVLDGILVGSFIPVGQDAINRFLPGLAPMPQIAHVTAAPSAEGMSAALEMSAGDRISDYTLDAQLELDAEREMQLY